MYQNRNVSNTNDNQRFTKSRFRFGNGAFRRAAADFSRKVWESAELEAQKNRISVLFSVLIFPLLPIGIGKVMGNVFAKWL